MDRKRSNSLKVQEWSAGDKMDQICRLNISLQSEDELF